MSLLPPVEIAEVVPQAPQVKHARGDLRFDTARTRYSGSGVDFARNGATVDTSAHLAGFTLAEVEQIGARVTASPGQSLASWEHVVPQPF